MATRPLAAVSRTRGEASVALAADLLVAANLTHVSNYSKRRLRTQTEIDILKDIYIELYLLVLRRQHLERGLNDSATEAVIA